MFIYDDFIDSNKKCDVISFVFTHRMTLHLYKHVFHFVVLISMLTTRFCVTSYLDILKIHTQYMFIK